MTDKELRRMSRSELLELLIAQMEENERLKESLENARAALESREIAIGRAGSIAEAALAINGVFEAAQASAAQYLENIRRMSGEQESICRRVEAGARKKTETICAEADAHSRRVRSETDAYSQKVRSEAGGRGQRIRPRDPSQSRRPAGMEKEAQKESKRARLASRPGGEEGPA